jgi:hypothetical protein
MKMRIAAASVLTATLMQVPATAHADDVPSVDQVVALLSQLSDSDRPAAGKSDVVTPAFDPQQAKRLDYFLNTDSAKGNLPMTFTAADIQPAPANSAGATVTAHENGHPTTSNPFPIVLVNAGGHWLITSDSAIALMNNVWDHYGRRSVGFA